MCFCLKTKNESDLAFHNYSTDDILSQVTVVEHL